MPQVIRIGELMDAHAPKDLILRFAAFTGLRSGELAALRVGDVTDMRYKVAKNVVVNKQTQCGADTRTKTEAGIRKPPLGTRLRDELEVCLSEVHPYGDVPSAPLWPGRMPGTKGDPRGLDFDRPFDVESFKKNCYKPVLERLSLENFSRHDLRHFYATTIIHSRRYGDKQVQEWMGHKSYASTVDRYGHAPEEDIESTPFDDLYDSPTNVTALERRSQAG